MSRPELFNSLFFISEYSLRMLRTLFSYSITGNDASYVSVNNDGVISFIELPDYETKSSYSITIDVSDGLNATSKGIIVQINNILEDVISSSFTISDGTSSQSPILNI